MAKDRRQINVKGGGLLQVREIDPTPTDAFTDLGYLKDVELSDTYNMVESKDAAGNYIDFKEAGETAILKGNLMETGKTNIDFQRLAAGKYFDVYYQVPLNNGSFQEIRAGCCRIKPGSVLSFKPGERLIQLEVHFLAPLAAFVATPTAFNITANVPYVLTEKTSTPYGTPTDTASDLAAAVI